MQTIKYFNPFHQDGQHHWLFSMKCVVMLLMNHIFNLYNLFGNMLYNVLYTVLMVKAFRHVSFITIGKKAGFLSRG